MNLQEMSLEQLKEIMNGAPRHQESWWDSEFKHWIYLAITDGNEAFFAYPHFRRVYCLVQRVNTDERFIKLSDIRARIAELEPKQKYDWSNVPDVVNWLATDNDGDCAWGFLEEPVIELEDEEWRPVAPYTEIYINGSTGTVAPYSGNWRESLEQRQFKIGDRVCFIRNIEPFQWGAKEKVYEVVDVADNLPTSTDQRVWLDTTASSPHLSRNLCLATAIGQVGIEDLPVHGEPISSEIITNAPVIDEPHNCNEHTEDMGSWGVRCMVCNIQVLYEPVVKPDTITVKLDPNKCSKVDPALPYDEPLTDQKIFPAPMTDGELHAPIGQKHDQGKPRYSLIPSSALASIVDVLEYGATKYAPDGWKHVKNARERYYNASMRHVQAWWSGEQNDPETGLPHLAHAICSLMFLMALKGEQGE